MLGRAGKWHLGMYTEAACPWRRGFDLYLGGYLQGCGSAYTHVASCCTAGSPNGTADQDYVCPAPEPSDDDSDPKDYRGYDYFGEGGAVDTEVNGTNTANLLTQAAVNFLTTPGRESRPFFLYLAFQNIHAPYVTDPEFRALYEGDPSLTEEEMTMFGYLSEMDTAVGSVVTAAGGSGLLDNMTIIFSSDNGAPGATGVRDRNWPFRGYKCHAWEGGVKVSAFVHSSLLAASLRGTESSALMHVVDWLPTIAHIAGVKASVLPPNMDGVNMWPTISSGASRGARSEVLLNINPLCDGGQMAHPKAALRVGQWKVSAFCYSVSGINGSNVTGPVDLGAGNYKGDSDWPKVVGDKPVALFNVEADPGETQDLAEAEPEVLAQLLARLAELAALSVEPQQWVKPYQGEDYECADCPLQNSTGANGPWLPWIFTAEM